MASFQAVRWAREMGEALRPFLARNGEELHKISRLIEELADLREAQQELTAKQLEVILQHLYEQELRSMEAHPGGVMAEFSGGGYQKESFLLRPDGAMPNAQYEAVPEDD